MCGRLLTKTLSVVGKNSHLKVEPHELIEEANRTQWWLGQLQLKYTQVSNVTNDHLGAKLQDTKEESALRRARSANRRTTLGRSNPCRTFHIAYQELHHGSILVKALTLKDDHWGDYSPCSIGAHQNCYLHLVSWSATMYFLCTSPSNYLRWFVI